MSNRAIHDPAAIRSTPLRAARVLVIDGYPVPRQGLAQLIRKSDDLEYVGAVENPTEALATITDTKPDVVVVELALNNGHGTDFIRSIKNSFADLAILVFSHQDETIFAHRAVRAGARGYVMKSEPEQTVLKAIRAVLDGDVYLSPPMALRMCRRLVDGQHAPRGPGIDRLSDRQLEVFELFGQYLDAREIAEKLNVSIKTVNTHKALIRKKLSLINGSDLVRLAADWMQNR